MRFKCLEDRSYAPSKVLSLKRINGLNNDFTQILINYRNYRAFGIALKLTDKREAFKRQSTISALQFLIYNCSKLYPIVAKKLGSRTLLMQLSWHFNVNCYEYITRQHVGLLIKKKMHCTSNVILEVDFSWHTFDLEFFFFFSSLHRFLALSILVALYKLLVSSFVLFFFFLLRFCKNKKNRLGSFFFFFFSRLKWIRASFFFFQLLYIFARRDNEINGAKCILSFFFFSSIII